MGMSTISCSGLQPPAFKFHKKFLHSDTELISKVLALVIKDLTTARYISRKSHYNIYRKANSIIYLTLLSFTSSRIKRNQPNQANTTKSPQPALKPFLREVLNLRRKQKYARVVSPTSKILIIRASWKNEKCKAPSERTNSGFSHDGNGDSLLDLLDH